MSQVQSENVPQTLPRAELSAGQRDEMFALLSRHFAGVTRMQFEADLSEKTWVILLRRDGRLVGFSTLLAQAGAFNRQPITAIYSGDTIVAPEAWGTTTLSRAWIACVRRLRENYPNRKCYWLFLTSGFRTYRFLPVFWREFYPRFDAPTPPNLKQLQDDLAQDRFGGQYQAVEGIVRFKNPQQLREGLRNIADGRMTDPHIAFFISKNPGHAAGDELVCLTELSDDNLTAAGRRMIES
ncbi:MAG TPA: hypothetical protein VGO57_07930 [Verrucomicrobiae bacterium]|jgi:hypothetical protein